jgi:hypothetical protein
MSSVWYYGDMKKIYLFLLLIFVVFGGIFVFKSKEVTAPTQMEDGGTTSNLPILPTVNDSLNITSPKAGAVIQSPLVVKGFAKGTWYFEASFPVKIVDVKGNIVGQKFAEAESDWMTEKFVPFSGLIEFTAKEGEKGFVVFQKDNPSGLPENDDELRVPIIFGAETIPVSVYFGNTKQGSSEDCSKVFSVTRYIAKNVATARGAITELLKGVSDEDKADGFFTSINAGVKIQKLTIENGTAKIDFSNDIEKNLGGSCRVTNIRAQIETTLKQFRTVKNVVISVDGRTEDILQP